MEDTTEKANRIYQEMFKNISGEEKIKMGFSMLGFAKRLSLASLEEKKLSEEELRKQMLVKIYGGDFEEERLERILKAV